MDLLMGLGIAVLAVVLLAAALAAWRVSRVVPLRAVAMTARATGSFEESVAYIRYCQRHAGR